MHNILIFFQGYKLLMQTFCQWVYPLHLRVIPCWQSSVNVLNQFHSLPLNYSTNILVVDSTADCTCDHFPILVDTAGKLQVPEEYENTFQANYTVQVPMLQLLCYYSVQLPNLNANYECNHCILYT